VVPVSQPTLFFSADPIIFFNMIDRATLFSLGGCGLLVQRAKMASVVTIIIEPNCLNSSVGIVTVFHNFYPCSKTVGIVTVFLHVRVQGFFQGFFRP
jgi:N-acetylglutamate synthase-like GNAT family acetyltransferase